MNSGSNYINIMQWNSRSLNNKWTELIHTLHNKNVHIAAVQETWFTQKIS